ncbi:MAG: FtsX-like permease family protein [Bacteroidota bacterium]
MNIFRLVNLRHMASEPGKFLLSVLGVALGVAVFIAIRIANNTALSSFEASIDVVSGKANLQILSENGAGIDENVYGKLKSLKAVQAITPVIEQYAQLIDEKEKREKGTGQPLLILGIDPFSDVAFRTYTSTTQPNSGNTDYLQFLTQKDAIFITENFARRAALKKGDSLPLVVSGEYRTFKILDVLKPEGTQASAGVGIGIVDIATAQEMFSKAGKLDRIDLIVPKDRIEEAEEYVSTLLPSGVVARTPAARTRQVQTMIGAYDLNLTALSFIALFVGMFIIYNTILISALRRRREIGILRAVGTSQQQVFFMFIAEAAFLGILGVAIGLPLGIFLAKLSLQQIAQTISNLYILVVVEDLIIAPSTLIIGAVIGIGAAVVSAIFPALEASRVSPRETFSLEQLETKFRVSGKRILISSAILLAGAGIASMQKTLFGKPVFGFIAAVCVVLGFALLMPALIVGFHAMLRPVFKKIGRAEGILANDYLVVALGRTSTATAALMTAIAMVVGLTVMIASFRSTVEVWINQTVSADIYVAPSSNRLAATTLTPIAPELLKELREMPEVAAQDLFVGGRMVYEGKIVSFASGNLTIQSENSGKTLKEGDWNEIKKTIDTAQIVLISESFSLKFDKHEGDFLKLATPSGEKFLKIAGIVYDYTSDAGLILMNRSLYTQLWRDTAAYQSSLYLKPGVNADEFRTRIEEKYAGKYSLLVYSNKGLRTEIFRIFDQTFAITYALQGISFIVAIIGIVNALTALVMERARELAVIRVNGASNAQMYGMIMTNSTLMGFISVVVGIVAGLVLSAILIYVINRQSFGWTIQVDVPFGVFLQSFLVVGLTSLVAGFLPAYFTLRRSLREALAFE